MVITQDLVAESCQGIEEEALTFENYFKDQHEKYTRMSYKDKPSCERQLFLKALNERDKPIVVENKYSVGCALHSVTRFVAINSNIYLI